jgi:hypothetical protein
VAQPMRSLRVWINSFIPGHLPGYTDRLTTGPRAGLTVLYGLAGGKEAYLTDQRMFSPALNVVSQMHSEALIDFKTSPAQLAQRHQCDFSMPLGDDGEPLEAPAADTSRMTVTMATSRTLSMHPVIARAVGVLPRRPGAPQEELFLYFSAKATLASERLAAHFGDLAYEGVAIIDPQRSAIEFHGNVHRFPAYEMYASVDEGAPVVVFRLSPPRGTGALDKVGPGMRVVKAAVSLA